MYIYDANLIYKNNYLKQSSIYKEIPLKLPFEHLK